LFKWHLWHASLKKTNKQILTNYTLVPCGKGFPSWTTIGVKAGTTYIGPETTETSPLNYRKLRNIQHNEISAVSKTF